MTKKRFKKIVKRIYFLHPMESIALLVGLIVLLLLVVVAGSKQLMHNSDKKKPAKPSVTATETPTPTDLPVEEPSVTLELPTPSPSPTGFVYVPGQCESVTTDKTNKPVDKDGWEVDPLMLVNWDSYLKYTGTPDALVLMKDIMTDSRYHFDDPTNAFGNETAVKALNQMCVDAMNAGCSDVKFSANGTYRDYKKQLGFWQQHINEDPHYGDDPYMRPVKTVPATCSEHRTGLGFDIWMIEYDYDWLHKNSYKYGFIVRYPADKFGYTGVMYEQWHFRYVGVEAATEMYKKNMCLEEYIAYLNGVTITPHPTAAVTPTPTPNPNKPTSTPTPVPTKVPGTSTPTPAPTPTNTPVPTTPGTPTSAPTPTTPATPTPTETPAPTNTPTPTPTPTEAPQQPEDPEEQIPEVPED